MSSLEERVAKLEEQNEDYRLRILALEMAVTFMTKAINPLVGEGYSISDSFYSAFSEVQKQNPEGLDQESLEIVKQQVFKALGGE